VLLTQKFAPFYTDPVVTVNVQLRVNITGLVAAPGHYLLDPTTTIVDALATAGGASGEVTTGSNIAGNPSAVRLIRDGAVIILDLRPEAADPTALGMRIQSGDWIYVPTLARSRLRDEIQFWGSLVSLFTGLAAAIVIIAGN
jgi:protein involved in polysaccharide export with SLBB domain